MKKKRYSAMFSVDASTNVEFEAEEGLTKEQIEDIASKEVEAPSVCHQCSDHIDVADIMDLIEIIDLDTNEILGEKKEEDSPGEHFPSKTIEEQRATIGAFGWNVEDYELRGNQYIQKKT